MRIVGSIPNAEFKITVFSWNERYIVKFEAGPFEQSYKFPVSLFETWTDLELLFDATFIDNIRRRFKEMVSDSESAYKRLSKNTSENKNAP